MTSLRELIRDFPRYVKMYTALLKDKRTPRASKILLGIGIGYFLSPIDLIPDFIPVVGHFDDAVIVPSLVYLALKFIPRDLYEEHRRRIFKNEEEKDENR